MLTLRLATSRIYSVRSIYPLNCQLSQKILDRIEDDDDVQAVFTNIA